MRRNVFFILIDCLRADHCYGEQGAAKTPVLRHLRLQGTSFTQAIAVATTTTPCVASIMTGLYPSAHGIRKFKGHKLTPARSTLAEILRRHGYRTCALVTGPLLPETGLNSGFETYHWRVSEEHLYAEWRNRLNAKLDGLARQREPWFFFLHLFEIHNPRYLSPGFNRPEFGATRYERALSSLDYELGKILERIDLEQTLVVLHGDHGERYESSIVERVIRTVKRRVGPSRGWYKLGHGYHVYDFLVRVPLIFVAPGLLPTGMQIDPQVRQIDIMPTILEALGIALDPRVKIQGRSLLPLIRDERAEELPALMEAVGGRLIPDQRDRLMGIRVPPWKYVFAPENPGICPELYHLGEDPRESNNLVDQHPAVVEKLRAAILDIQSCWEKEGAVAAMTLEEQAKVEERLRELGYID